MAYTLIQSGSSLYTMDSNGVMSSALTLPSGVSLNTAVPPRFALINGYVVMVNSPSRPLIIGGDGKVRVLSAWPPRTQPTCTATGSGSLTGVYTFKQTFLSLDSSNNVITESDFGPISTSDTASSEVLQASALDLSLDIETINATRIYRTAAGGAIYYQWLQLAGNSQTSITDGTADSALSIVAAPTLGTAPILTLVAEFRGRLFGVGKDAVDSLRYTEAGLHYSWPVDNVFQMEPKGADAVGVTALMSRADRLGVAKLNRLRQIVGTGADTITGDIDLDNIIASDSVGCLSQESVQVFRDTAYFLWYDGVYQWNNDGIKNLAEGKVKNWFTSDSYFNRNRFSKSFAHIDIDTLRYRLFLAEPSASSENVWIEYDIRDGTWWGPHKSTAVTPTSAFVVQQDSGKRIPVIGDSGGDLFQEQTTRTDSTASGIAIDVKTKRHDGEEPDLDKYFGELSMIGKAQSAGTLTVAGRTGELNQSSSTTSFSYDMTKSRQRLGRLGVGKHSQLEFTHSTAGQDVELYGYDIDPVNIAGKR